MRLSSPSDAVLAENWTCSPSWSGPCSLHSRWGLQAGGFVYGAGQDTPGYPLPRSTSLIQNTPCASATPGPGSPWNFLGVESGG